MKKVQNTLITALSLAMLGAASTSVNAEVTGNVGMTNDYLWRGTTQNNHDAAISGGIDYGHSSGIYAGTWVSDAALFGGTEVDLYGGFAGEVAGVSYDIGYITYNYPQESTSDFSEVYVSVGYSIAGVSYSVDSENETTYLAVDLGTEAMGLSLGLNFGMYMNEDSDSDYMHYGVSVGKGIGGDWDATFALSATDLEDGATGNENPQATVSISKSFDLIK